MRVSSRPRTIRVWVRAAHAFFADPTTSGKNSYPVITPSAARGLLENVYKKPEFRYRINRIGIIKAGTTFSVVTNDVKNRAGATPIDPTRDEHHTQQLTVRLQDVEYLIECSIHPEPHADKPEAAYRAQLIRRLERGEYFRSPYAGREECFADVALAARDTTPDGSINADFGSMPLDFAYLGPRQPYYYHAVARDGWIDVPTGVYDDIIALERRPS
jgi:CRISPR-associated protein Cas5d